MSARMHTKVLSKTAGTGGVRGHLCFPVDEALKSLSGARMPLRFGETTIGRQDCDISIPRPTISKVHATVHVSAKGGLVFMEDERSANKTYVVSAQDDDDTIQMQPNKQYQVLDGTIVQLGQLRLSFELPKDFTPGHVDVGAAAVDVGTATLAPAEEDVDDGDALLGEGGTGQADAVAAPSDFAKKDAAAEDDVTRSPPSPRSVDQDQDAVDEPSAPKREAGSAITASPADGGPGSDCDDVLPPSPSKQSTVHTRPPPAVSFSMSAVRSVPSVVGAEASVSSAGGGDVYAEADPEPPAPALPGDQTARLPPSLDLDLTASPGSRSGTAVSRRKSSVAAAAAAAEQEDEPPSRSRGRKPASEVGRKPASEVGRKTSSEVSRRKPASEAGRKAAEPADEPADEPGGDAEDKPTAPAAAAAAAAADDDADSVDAGSGIRGTKRKRGTEVKLEAPETPPAKRGRKKAPAPVERDSDGDAADSDTDSVAPPAAKKRSPVSKKASKKATAPGSPSKRKRAPVCTADDDDDDDGDDEPGPAKKMRAAPKPKAPEWYFVSDLRKTHDEDDDSIWRKYPADTNAALEAAFQRGQKECTINSGSFKYLIKFGEMVQYRKDARYKQRGVKRVAP